MSKLFNEIDPLKGRDRHGNEVAVARVYHNRTTFAFLERTARERSYDEAVALRDWLNKALGDKP